MIFRYYTDKNFNNQCRGEILSKRENNTLLKKVHRSRMFDGIHKNCRKLGHQKFQKPIHIIYINLILNPICIYII